MFDSVPKVPLIVPREIKHSLSHHRKEHEAKTARIILNFIKARYLQKFSAVYLHNFIFEKYKLRATSLPNIKFIAPSLQLLE